MIDKFSNFLRHLTPLLLALIFCTNVEAAGIQKQPPVRLQGHIPTQALENALLIENLRSLYTIPVTFTFPLRNQDELTTLLQVMYDPTDVENYHKFLTTEEFNQRFAPTQADYDKVIAYAKSIGLTVTGTHPNRTLLNVSGRVKSFERGFNLHLKHYQLHDGRKFYAPGEDPQVPPAIASIISGIVGLDNIAKMVFDTWDNDKDLITQQFVQAQMAIFQQMAAQGQAVYVSAGGYAVFQNEDPNIGYALYYDGQWTIYGDVSMDALFDALQPPSVKEEDPLVEETPLQDFDLTMKHKSPFTKGGMGKYTIIVKNEGSLSSTGEVAVGITLPEGLQVLSVSGMGWSFDAETQTCTYTESVQAGSSLPAIELAVSVAEDAPYTVIPLVTVSGQGFNSISTTDRTTTRFP